MGFGDLCHEVISWEIDPVADKCILMAEVTAMVTRTIYEERILRKIQALPESAQENRF
ncbi:MAG: hypothetical protein HQM09_22795 [Candidatus Riflebacteria bacterium]|nr:hypothetical protein [Candidatus Riflebacteria bacterium]